MTTLLLDGSNIALNGAGPGKLQKLTRLAEVIDGLIEHGHEPYTIFDASFRWRLPEGSEGRIEFEQLTKRVAEFFQLSPSGEKADLFLLESALALGVPVLSNDTFREYGKLANGVLSYKGGKISIYNFQAFAGVLVVPDLDIRWKVVRQGERLGDIAARIEQWRKTAEPEAQTATEATICLEACPHPAEALPDGEAQLDTPSQLDETRVSAIVKIIRKFRASGHRSVAELAGRLKGHRRNYQAQAGIGDKNKKRWFGYSSLDEFIRNRLPQFKITDGKIDGSEGH